MHNNVDGNDGVVNDYNDDDDDDDEDSLTARCNGTVNVCDRHHPVTFPVCLRRS